MPRAVVPRAHLKEARDTDREAQRGAYEPEELRVPGLLIREGRTLKSPDAARRGPGEEPHLGKQNPQDRSSLADVAQVRGEAPRQRA